MVCVHIDTSVAPGAFDAHGQETNGICRDEHVQHLPWIGVTGFRVNAYESILAVLPTIIYDIEKL